MYAKNELLFPHCAIPSLRGTRGAKWDELIERVMRLPEDHEETLAFMLTMIRINGCMGCETDSYRAMRGCAACSQQTLRRYKGSDEDLFDLFEQALKDVQAYLQQNPKIVRAIMLEPLPGF